MNILKHMLMAATLSAFSSCAYTQETQNQLPRLLSITHQGKPTFKFSSSKIAGEDPMESFDFVVNYKGSVVYRCESKMEDPVVAGEIQKNAPKTGCQSIIAYTSNGGVHCCANAILGISCDAADYLINVDLQHSGGSRVLEDVDKDGVKELVLSNWDFAYYQPDKKGDHSLSFAESPAMTHYAIWTSQGWKATRPGEFKNVYKRHLNEALQIKPKEAEDTTGQAIEVAYYSLMAGNSEKKARQLLTKLLPKNWKSISNTVFSDIQNSISNFSAVGVSVPTPSPKPLPQGKGKSAKGPVNKDSLPDCGEGLVLDGAKQLPGSSNVITTIMTSINRP